MSPKERLLSRIRTSPQGCWLFTSNTSHSRDAQGYVRWYGKMRGAHRIMYELVHGPQTRNTQILHECGNDICVKPSHLYAVTQTSVID